MCSMVIQSYNSGYSVGVKETEMGLPGAGFIFEGSCNSRKDGRDYLEIIFD